MTKLILLLIIAGFGTANAEPANWAGNYAPCERNPDLLKREHVDLGVRFATANLVLAQQFERAMEFWSGILDLNWHEVETAGCSIQLVDGSPELFGTAGTAARSQIPGRQGFQGWIAFNPGVRLSEREMFTISVHEIGHLLGLPHNPSGSSVMFFLELEGPLVLDGADLMELAKRHRLRSGVFGQSGTAVARVAIP
jgi:hypothetical protein